MKEDKKKEENKKLDIIKLVILTILLIALIVVSIVLIVKRQTNDDEQDDKVLAYTELVKEIQNKNVEKIEMTVGSTTLKVKLKDEEEEKTYTYTFDLDGDINGETGSTYVDVLHLINKIGEETKKITTEGETKTVKAALEGAEFTVYTDAECTTVYKNTIKPTGYVVLSNTAGQIELKGLAAGTYYIKETKAPSGYSLNATPIKVEIVATY